MPKKRYNAEEIIYKLREAEVLLSQGKSVSQACKQLGVSDQTYYRWRKSYGGMKVDQVERLISETARAPTLLGPYRKASYHLPTRKKRDIGCPPSPKSLRCGARCCC